MEIPIWILQIPIGIPVIPIWIFGIPIGITIIPIGILAFEVGNMVVRIGILVFYIGMVPVPMGIRAREIRIPVLGIFIILLNPVFVSFLHCTSKNTYQRQGYTIPPDS